MLIRIQKGIGGEGAYAKLLIKVREGNTGQLLHPNNESLLAALSNPNAKFDPLQNCDSYETATARSTAMVSDLNKLKLSSLPMEQF
jgi:hypothetical protein